MSMNQARFGLMGIFLVGLVLQLGALFHVRQGLWEEDFDKLILRLLAIYSAQLGLVLGGMFAQPKTALADPPAGLAWSALALVALWNLLLVWRMVSFSLAEQDSVANLMKYLDSIAAGSSFLVAGVLAFFFGKGTEATTSPH